MRSIAVVLWVNAACFSAHAQSTTSASALPPAQPSPQSTTSSGPLAMGPGREAEQQISRLKTDDRIAALSKLVNAQLRNLHDQNLLALAYIQKMRETVDFGYVNRASQIIDRVLEQDAGNYEALRLRSEISMERHEFKQVVEFASEFSKLAPDDPWNWGTLGDASMELGDYKTALAAYTRMFSLRADLNSYNRLGYYHFVTGDVNGAIAMMQSAIASGTGALENKAWCLTDLGNIYFKTGQLDAAFASFQNALEAFPGYYPAFAGLGRVLAARGKTAEAIASYKKAQNAVPMPDFAAAIETLAQLTGDTAEAKRQRELIEFIDKMARAGNEKANRNLAIIYADRKLNLDRARELVDNEIKVRPDIYTHDARAWVLFQQGETAAASEEIQKAVILQTAEPTIFFHAGMIAAKLGDRDTAAKYLQKALALNPHFDPLLAGVASSALQTVTAR